MNDLLPQQTPVWQYLENRVSSLLARYGYSEIRFPILESTSLFKRAIGEVTDIVEKEMYTFEDRSGDSVTLRPEGTAGCVRACEQSGLLFNQIQRLWYQGPMFRYERPQKGRLRQFHQIGAEVFGLAGPDIDAEMLVMQARLWRELGIDHAVTLQINSLGTSDSRRVYRDSLVAYLQGVQDQLDTDSQRRLASNPLRILDSKDAHTQELLDGAPSLFDCLDDESRAHFDELCALLDAAGVRYEVNPRLVRGLDYYSKTVFEWVTDALGAQGTVCAGGRYDGLVEQLGGKPTPAVGFAMGVERLTLLLEELDAVPGTVREQVDIYLISTVAPAEAAVLAEQVRDAYPRLRVMNHCGGGSLKSQFKKADRSGARIALVLGGSELEQGTVTIKCLRSGREQLTLPRERMMAGLDDLLAASDADV